LGHMCILDQHPP